MPKGKRGSRGKSKGRANRVQLGIKVRRVPAGTTREDVRAALLESLYRDDYRLPEGWIIQISWSNNGGKTRKYDEWQNALIDSLTGGRGWDGLMERYLTEVY